MNLKQIEVFVSVAETCSFSRAAEATFITQSTVSQHISALEAEFGIRLFDRTAKGALLTEAGKLLRGHALQLLADGRRLREAMARFTGLQEAELRVAASNIPGTYMIPQALPMLLQRFPGVTVKLWQGDSRDAVNKIISEEAETGVVGDAFDDARLEFTPFGSDRVILVVPPGHRWDAETLPLETIATEPLIMRESGSGTGRSILSALEKQGLQAERLTVKAYLGSNEAVKSAVASGMGVAFVSEMSVKRELARGELATAVVEGVNIRRSFYLARRAGRELSPAATAFAALLGELFR